MEQGHCVKVMEFEIKGQSTRLSSCRGQIKEQAFQKNFGGLQNNAEMCNWVCMEERGEGVEGMSRWVIAAPAYCPRNAAAARTIRGQPTASLKDPRCQSLRSVLGICSVSPERKSPSLLYRANARSQSFCGREGPGMCLIVKISLNLPIFSLCVKPFPITFHWGPSPFS